MCLGGVFVSCELPAKMRYNENCKFNEWIIDSALLKKWKCVVCRYSCHWWKNIVFPPEQAPVLTVQGKQSQPIVFSLHHSFRGADNRWHDIYHIWSGRTCTRWDLSFLSLMIQTDGSYHWFLSAQQAKSDFWETNFKLEKVDRPLLDHNGILWVEATELKY